MLHKNVTQYSQHSMYWCSDCGSQAVVNNFKEVTSYWLCWSHFISICCQIVLVLLCCICVSQNVFVLTIFICVPMLYLYLCCQFEFVLPICICVATMYLSCCHVAMLYLCERISERNFLWISKEISEWISEWISKQISKWIIKNVTVKFFQGNTFEKKKSIEERKKSNWDQRSPPLQPKAEGSQN